MDILLLLLTILPFVASFPELTHDGRVIQHPGLIRYPIAVSEAPPHTKRYFRRQDNADLTSQSTGFFYTIDVVIGTPGQSVPLGFDTGSWEFWVNPNCSNTAEKTVCRSFPRFTGSTTLVNTNRTGQITYGAGYAKFNYMYDFVSVGTARINQQIFGVAYDTAVVAYGNFGVGPWILGWRSPYPSVLDSLVNQNHINRKAFSLDLRPINNPRGAVIFGGIDTKKYTGPLEKRPIITGPDGSTRYWVYLDGLSVTREDGSQLPVFDEANSLTVLLDSGTTLTQLPTKMVTEILKAFPSARQDPDNKGQYLVDCSVANLAGTVNFRFGNTSIRAQYNDFIWKQPQNNLCILGVSPNDSFFILGDTFLRSAYVVFDMDNRSVFVANTADCGTNLVAIGKGPEAVPSVTGACLASGSLMAASTLSSAQTTSVAVAATSGAQSPRRSSNYELPFTSSNATLSSTALFSTRTTSGLSTGISSTTQVTYPSVSGSSSGSEAPLASLLGASSSPQTPLKSFSDFSSSAQTTLSSLLSGTASAQTVSTAPTLASIDVLTTKLSLSSETSPTLGTSTADTAIAAISDTLAALNAVSSIAITSAAPSRHLMTAKSYRPLSDVVVTETYIITSCAPIISQCMVGKATTRITAPRSSRRSDSEVAISAAWVAQSTTRAVNAGTTGIYTLPPFICGKGATNCSLPATIPTPVVTVVPIITQAIPISVESFVGCVQGQPKSNTVSSAADTGLLNTHARTVATKSKAAGPDECFGCDKPVKTLPLPMTAAAEPSIMSVVNSHGVVPSGPGSCHGCSASANSSIVAAGADRRFQTATAGVGFILILLAMVV